ncbi:AAA family ATPase [Thermotoga profunda]|uniref:AAA family ATPase n=1 Tax=Thermotoga profunda TaxID=1508420 RepID=UPI00059789A8|nr:AAA family ATPase [Thermotoga profunda]
MIIRFAGKNLLYFDQFEFSFSEGLNVITGETGAGKSILLRALQAVLGKKVDLPSSENCYLEIFITLPKKNLADFGIDEDEIVVSLSPGKRWVYKLNGKMCTQSMVEMLFEDTVHFHQQNSQTGLLKPKNQQIFLDGFLEDQRLLQEYSQLYQDIKELEKFLNEVDIEKIQKEIDVLQSEVEYFDRMRPSEEEENLLKERYERILKRQQIAEIFSQITSVIENDSPNGFAVLWEVLQKSQKIANMLPNGFVDLLEETLEKSEELNRIAKSSLQELELEDIKEVEQRIWDYNDLKRRYGPEMKDVIEHIKKTKSRYDELSNKLKNFSQAKEQIRKLRNRAFELAQKIHDQRVKVITDITEQVEKHLKDLAMNMKFSVKIERLPDLSPNGIDQIEFVVLLPNQDQLPIKNILSGGELSRLLLSLELVSATNLSSQILIFDEVDTGIGGMVGNVLGKKLKDVSMNFQTIVVTHLPQIAAYADRHFVVERSMDKMVLRVLSEDEKRKEMLRMIGGEEIFKR